MFGFTKVEWTDHELAAFVKKHDLFHTSANGMTNWKRRGAMDYTHVVVIYDNAQVTRKIYVNAEVWEAELQKKGES
jgi:hypothetical protein